MKTQVDGAGRLNDPDGADKGLMSPRGPCLLAATCPHLGPLLGIFISDLDENINYMLVKYTFSKY